MFLGRDKVIYVCMAGRKKVGYDVCVCTLFARGPFSLNLHSHVPKTLVFKLQYYNKTYLIGFDKVLTYFYSSDNMVPFQILVGAQRCKRQQQ